MTILAAIVRIIGLPACVVIALLVYYEGLPVVSQIPYIHWVPLVGDLAIGEKQRYASDQVKIATARQKAQCEADMEKMVSTVQYETLAAQLAEERRQASVAVQISEEYRKRTDAALRGEADAKQRLEKAIAEDTGNDDDRWQPSDLEWLRNNRQGRGGPR